VRRSCGSSGDAAEWIRKGEQIRKKERRRKKERGKVRVIQIFYNLNATSEAFCKMFSKTASAPSEKPLHQRRQSRSRF
jgi:hypothetical protein